VRYPVAGAPLVSIIIATRDRLPLLRQCIRSIEERTAYRRYEILVIDNDSREPDALSYLEALARRWPVHRAPGAFNFAAINNLGVRHARGEHLLFLNNDTQVIAPDWLEAMIEHAQRPEVGAVGAKLLFPDGRIQHAGVVVGLGGIAGHAFKHHTGVRADRAGLPDVVRNCSAVTGACLMVSRARFDEVQGFDERLRVVFNDIDLCLRLRERGYLIVFTPRALLYHYESASRGRREPPDDLKLFRSRWGEALRRGDPYYNPNLTLAREDWSLRF
jgi:GT2 family glycosyltransferase